jgi:glycosyltransferase involved in cell wall biosynthesis
MTRHGDRELPEHEQVVLGPRLHDYALVIPVINEGERIRSQLRRISSLSPGVDVVIADGGSTDGSLDREFLTEANVRALLTKRGSGRLSAQLRMAYAWVLDQGYRGVITIDGNGKDGVDAINDFITRLDQGYDYVQGSRYLRGGKALNTPFDRKIAGRFVHAPILSLASRQWYTDTTNGFRGYSARYLADPRVNPFRDIFDRYSLLFYLTVRAGQLGLRTTELPVTRSYPAGEKTPTKINGFRSRLSLFHELMKAALGKYNPRL